MAQTRYTFLELVNICLRRAGNRPSIQTVASPNEGARFFMRELHLWNARICKKASWEWLRKVGEVELWPYRSITGSAGTNGSNVWSLGSNLQFDATDDPDCPYVGGYIGRLGDWYRILNVTSPGNNVTTDLDFLRTTFSNGIVEVVQDGFQLPADFDRPLNSTQFVTAPWVLREVDPETFFRIRQYDATRRSTWESVGIPEFFTVWGKDGAATPRSRILVTPFPEKAATLQVHYYRKHTSLAADADLPDIPEQFQDVLLHFALAEWHRKELDFAKSMAQRGMAQAILNRMLLKAERTAERPAMQVETSREHYRL